MFVQPFWKPSFLTSGDGEMVWVVITKIHWSERFAGTEIIVPPKKVGLKLVKIVIFFLSRMMQDCKSFPDSFNTILGGYWWRHVIHDTYIYTEQSEKGCSEPIYMPPCLPDCCEWTLQRQIRSQNLSTLEIFHWFPSLACIFWCEDAWAGVPVALWRRWNFALSKCVRWLVASAIREGTILANWSNSLLLIESTCRQGWSCWSPSFFRFCLNKFPR